jgi:hypothetical protein
MWSSYLHVVPKKDSQFSALFQRLSPSQSSYQDRHPLPSLMDFSNKLYGCAYTLVLDLLNGYHRIPMVAADVLKTAVVTFFSHCKYCICHLSKRMQPAQMFKWFMDQIFRFLPCVFAHLDNHLIASRTLEISISVLPSWMRTV